MPIYEFRCRACRRKTTAIVLVRERAAEVRCAHCGGADLERLWSRFATPKSEEARLDALAGDAGLAGLDENDPAAMARWMKKMGREMGEDLGEDFEEALAEGSEGSEGSEGPEGPEGPEGSEGGGEEL
jgi:putative FmdB family regulatory protein